MSPGLNGRTALVTGSSRGIGRAIAEALARAGARVVLTARGEADLADAAAAVAAAGPEPRIEACDFADAAEVEALFDRLDADGVEIDVLVGNVGVARIASFADVDDAEWRLNWEVNVMSAVRAARRALPGMVERGWGRIVHVSSSAGKRPSAKWPAYAPTKAALQALTMVLADEYGGAGVTINVVCPGPVRTSMWTEDDGLWRAVAREGETREEVLERIAAGLPAGRMGEPGDVAAAVAFLCSEEAAWIHGAALSIDGGNVRIVV
ncbi:MAG TPA: SDR family oxidoreductase [Gemmatimonadota bacterium]|nr:SDR family oxidoreductase [Gemmatimonadota bacterium]